MKYSYLLATGIAALALLQGCKVNYTYSRDEGRSGWRRDYNDNDYSYGRNDNWQRPDGWGRRFGDHRPGWDHGPGHNPGWNHGSDQRPGFGGPAYPAPNFPAPPAAPVPAPGGAPSPRWGGNQPPAPPAAPMPSPRWGGGQPPLPGAGREGSSVMQLISDQDDPATLLARDYGIRSRSARKIMALAQSSDKAPFIKAFGLNENDLEALSRLEKPSSKVVRQIATKLGEKSSKVDRILTDFLSDARAQ